MNIRLLDASIALYDTLPIWSIYLITTLLLFLSFELGYQISKYTAVGSDKVGFNSTGPMVSGLLGMLAFVLAFTFAMASSQHNLRKQHVIQEANIIGTAYLRADLLGERDADKIKTLLKEYVNGRVHALKMGDLELTSSMLKRAEEIHGMLWTQAMLSVKKEPSLSTMLLIESINDVIDSHANRVTAGMHNRIPSTIWYVLLTIAALTMMTMGYQARLSKSRRLAAVIPLIMAFTALSVLVLDLDRPQEGMVTVGQEPMVDLQKSLNKDEL